MPGLTLRWLASKASPSVITAQRMRAFLLARRHRGVCQPERSRSVHSPCRDPVRASVRGQHRRLGALDQQRAQVGVASLGDAAQPGLAAAGVLPGRQPDPGAELRTVLELLEVADGGHHRRRRHRADAQQRGGVP